MSFRTRPRRGPSPGFSPPGNAESPLATTVTDLYLRPSWLTPWTASNPPSSTVEPRSTAGGCGRARTISVNDSVDRLASALSDRYRIDSELGAGGMATVYLAEDLKHHRKVAVKVLRPELAAILGGERFLKEIRVTANLQHPNILPLYDSGEADIFLYYVMPHVEGESLRDRLNRDKQLPVEEAVREFKSVAVTTSPVYVLHSVT